MMIISITLVYSERECPSLEQCSGTLYSYQMVVTLLSLPIVLLSPHLSTGYIICAITNTQTLAFIQVCNVVPLFSEDHSVGIQFTWDENAKIIQH